MANEKISVDDLIGNLDSEQKVALNSAVEEQVIVMEKRDMLKKHSADIITRVKEEFGISRTDFNSIVNQRFDKKFTAAAEKADAVVEADEQLLTAAKNIGGVQPIDKSEE